MLFIGLCLKSPFQKWFLWLPLTEYHTSQCFNSSPVLFVSIALFYLLSIFPQLNCKLHENREYFIYNVFVFRTVHSIDTHWGNKCFSENLSCKMHYKDKTNHQNPREGYESWCFSTIWTWIYYLTFIHFFSNYWLIMLLSTHHGRYHVLNTLWELLF